MRILILALFLSFISVGAFAQTTTITGLPGSTTIGTQDVLPLDQTIGSTTTTVKETADNVVANVLTNIATQFSGLCGTFAAPATCTYIFGWADPRNYGGFCAANWNTNNSTQDDGPAIALAMQSGYPVLIPAPGCKIASTVKYTSDLQSISSVNRVVPYRQLHPESFDSGAGFLFIPSTISGTAQNCAIDFNGYEGVALTNVVLHGPGTHNTRTAGTTALCDSYSNGSGNAPRANFLDFTYIDNIDIGDVAMAFGTPTDSSGVPISQPCNGGSCMGGSYVQLQMSNFIISQAFWGMRFNMSDTQLHRFYMASIQGPALSSFNQFGSWQMSDGRIEFDGNIAHANGAVYVGGYMEGTNIEFDHNNTASVEVGSGGLASLVNGFMDDSPVGAVSGYDGFIVLDSGAGGILLNGIQGFSTSAASHPLYGIVSKGASSIIAVMGSSTGPGNFGFTAPFNLSATPTYMNVDSPGIPYRIFTTTLYTVSTLPTGIFGMEAYVSDQATACPAPGGALTGSGGITCRAWYNGSAWVGE